MMRTPDHPDIAAGVPALAAYQRVTVRLHPRRGDPSAYDSSIGGPVLLGRDVPELPFRDDEDPCQVTKASRSG